MAKNGLAKSEIRLLMRATFIQQIPGIASDRNREIFHHQNQTRKLLLHIYRFNFVFVFFFVWTQNRLIAGGAYGRPITFIDENISPMSPNRFIRFYMNVKCSHCHRHGRRPMRFWNRIDTFALFGEWRPKSEAEMSSSANGESSVYFVVCSACYCVIARMCVCGTFLIRPHVLLLIYSTWPEKWKKLCVHITAQGKFSHTFFPRFFPSSFNVSSFFCCTVHFNCSSHFVDLDTYTSYTHTHSHKNIVTIYSAQFSNVLRMEMDVKAPPHTA